VLHLDALAPRTPRLPRHRWGAPAQLAASTALHLICVVIAALAAITWAPTFDVRRAQRIIERQEADVRHLVFVAPAFPVGSGGGGGGGGGNQQPDPIRRAQGLGTDRVTLRVQRRPLPTAVVPAVLDVPSIPSIVLDAKPLASGLFDQIGLPTAGVTSGTSTGPGSGGGVGTGNGTGIGSGRGPGFGTGSGGGTGGGVYRAGGSVSAPRLIKEVKPAYTKEALRARIQGTVMLEAVITSDGCTSQLRIVRSLDPGGLDEDALTAVSQWRFEPGRLGATPVDVLVTIALDFAIR
jgi:protein TonB